MTNNAQQAGAMTAVVPPKKSDPTPLDIGGKRIELRPEVDRFLLLRSAEGWRLEEVAKLGESDVFVRRDPTGDLQLIVKSVPLRADRKEIVNAGQGGWQITVPGYRRLNQFAGLHVVTPDSLFVEGKNVGNPYVQYEGNRKVRIISRKVVIGHSPNGNLVAVDSIRLYDFDAYFLQDLMAKAKKSKNSAALGSRWICPLAPGAKVEEKENGNVIARQEAQGKVFLYIQIKDQVGIWYDPTDSEIGEVFSTHIQHMKYGDVIAASLAERNGLKAHPAIAATVPVVVNGVADIQVYGWRHGLTRDRLVEIANTIARGEPDPEVSSVITEQGEASPEEVLVAETTEGADEDPQAGGGSVVLDQAQNTSGVTGNAETDERERLAGIRQAITQVSEEKGVDPEKLSRTLFNGRQVAQLPMTDAERLLQVIRSTSTRREGVRS